MLVLDIPSIHHFIDTWVNVLSVLFNVYLLYLIKCHSSFTVKLYKWLLTIDASLDLLLGLISLITQPVAVFADGYCVIISNGYFANIFSRELMGFALTLYAVILHTNILWIPVQFIYRYRFLERQTVGLSGRNGEILTAIFTVVWTAIAYAVLRLMFAVPNSFESIGIYILQQNSWPIDSANPPVAYGAHMSEPRMIGWLTVYGLSSFGGIVAVVYCEKMMMLRLNMFAMHMHETTKRMHAEFHRALLAMAICPIVTSALPVFLLILVCALQICPGSWTCLLMSAVTSITMFNPLTTIFFMGCYRRHVLKHFRKKRTSPSASAFMTHVSGLEPATTATLTVPVVDARDPHSL